jgi:hypothetical protein
MQPETKAVIFGAASTAVIVLMQIAPSPEPGFTGAAFTYNVLFFFPLFIVSFVCWSLAIVFYMFFVRGSSRKTPVMATLPVLLLLACPFQLAIIARELWILSHLPSPPT